MNKTQKILIVTQKVDVNDAVLGFFHRWLEEFSKDFSEVIVICLEERTHSLPAHVRVLSLGKDQGLSRLGYVLRFFTYIWRERNNYDVVFVHMNQVYVILGGLLWKILSKKIGLWYTHAKVSASLRIAEMFTDVVFTASHASFRLVSKKLNIVGHGIDTDVFKNIQVKGNDEVFKVLSVGRISRVKGYETLIDAAKIIAENEGGRGDGADRNASAEPKIVFEIIGGPLTNDDRTYAASIKEKIQAQNLAQRFALTASIPHQEIVPHLCTAGVFVNLSNTGSLDKAVLEAMACERPVLVSNEAFTEMLEPLGLMFEPKNAGQLTEKIHMLAADPEKRAYLGRTLRDIVVREHNLSGLIKKIAAVYAAYNVGDQTDHEASR